jgi:Bacterial SH3 domain
MINFIKLFLGIVLGLTALAVLTGSAGYYFFATNLSVKPKRPTFAEESRPKPKASPKPSKVAKEEKEKEKEEKTEPKQSPLPPGAYGGSITWSTGVSLRTEPSDNSDKAGSVGFKEKVTVLKASPDKQWLQVRNSDNTQEGWLKAGNVEKEAGN